MKPSERQTTFNNWRLILIVVIVFIVCKLLIFGELYGVNGKLLGQKIKFSDVYNKKSTNIAKLMIRSGNTGEAYETTDPAKINEFLKLMDKARFDKELNQGSSSGWRYCVDLFDNKEETKWFSISFGRVFFSRVNTNLELDMRSPYYDIQNSEVIMKGMDNFYDSMKISGKALQ